MKPTWQQVAVLAVVVAGLVAVALTNSAAVGIFVGALNALLPSVLASKS